MVPLWRLTGHGALCSRNLPGTIEVEAGAHEYRWFQIGGRWFQLSDVSILQRAAVVYMGQVVFGDGKNMHVRLSVLQSLGARAIDSTLKRDFKHIQTSKSKTQVIQVNLS